MGASSSRFVRYRPLLAIGLAGLALGLAVIGWLDVAPSHWMPIFAIGTVATLFVCVVVLGAIRRADALRATSSELSNEVAERRQAEEALQATLDRARRQLEAIGQVSQSEELLSGEIESLARRITEVAARTVGCERANLWLFDEAETVLKCIDLYEATPDRHSSGPVLEESQYRHEFEAFKAGKHVAADDALTDPRTTGYVESYVKPLSITSMLDTVIQMSGKNLGLLCFEHVGKAHHWEQDEIAFANQLADKFAIALVSRRRREAERALRASEEKFRTIFDSVTDAVFAHELQSGRFVAANKRAVEMFGYSLEEILAGNVGTLSAEGYTQEQAMAQLAAAGTADLPPFEWGFKARDGRLFWGEVRLRRTALGGEEVVLATVRDITEQRRSAAALRDSRQILEGVLNAIPVRVFWKDKNLVYLGCNRPFAIDAGFKEPAELIGKDDFQMGWRGQAEIYRKDDREVIASGVAKLLIEEPQTTPGGQTITLLTTKVPLRAPDGGIDGILGVYMDITERKRAEEALRASEAELSEAQRLAKLGSWSWSPRDDKVTWSEELYSILGFDPAQPPPNVAAQEKLFTEQSYRELRRALAQTLREHTPYAIDLEFKRPDGAGGWLLARGEAECDSAGHLVRVRGTALDITERKQAEEALAYRDRVQHAVTAAAADVIGGDTLSQGVERALKTVGEALDVDRVAIMEGPGADRPPTVRHAWQRTGIQPLTQEMLTTSGITGTKEEAEWMAPARRNQAVITHRHSASPAIRNMMTRYGIQSVLTVPVMTAGRFWGIIGVDVCRESRQWSAAEIETLQTFAEVLGIVIVRQGDLESLRRSEERFRAVSETAQDAIILTDAAGRIEFWNPAAERILGHGAAEAIGRDIAGLITPESHREQVRAGLNALAGPSSGEASGKTMEFSALRRDGSEVPVEVSVAGLLLGEERHAVAVLRDISERKRAEAQIARMARYDALTGLANRNVFVEGLQRSIAVARRSGKQFAVLYLDLDHFKDINDTLGHPMGDRLLKGVGERLQAGIRENDIVARFGGDEFAVIQTDIETPEEAALLADRLVRALAEPFAIADNEVRTGASIGIAVYGVDSPDAESLLSHADVALYRAKSEGRGTWRFFTTAMDEEVRARVALGGELRSAIASGQLFLEYQPQIDARSGHIVGVEALVRWNHPVRGIVGPAQFIPVAERSGLIVPLGHWVLEEACRQARLWLDRGVQVPLMAVNVSARQFKAPLELEQDIDDVLRRTGFPADRLELELTESVLIEASREHNDALLRLRQKGIRLAVDDFGTGYSSLDYLRRFPVHRIKIAQTFVTSLTETSSTAAIVKAAIGLAHELNLDVVVEGVETARQLALVGGWGGNQIQGFYFSPPLSAAEIEPLLRAGRVAPADRAARHVAAAG